MRRIGLLATLVLLLAPAALTAQGDPRPDSLATPGLQLSAASRIRLQMVLPPALRPLGRFTIGRLSTTAIAEGAAAAVTGRLAERLLAQQRATFRPADELDLLAAAALAIPAAADSMAPPVQPDTGLGRIFDDLLGDRGDLGLQLRGVLETKIDRSRNERCTASQIFTLAQQCASGFQPAFDFQFDSRINGNIANRIFVNVDFDTQREFEASNNISVYYRGKTDELLERLEVGNVSFQPPPSQFITTGIPQGNYGVQAIGQLGPMRFRTIAAQQKGNVSGANQFMIGDRTLRTEDKAIEDYQIEPRRFFFTVDPLLFGSAYPNVDLLNAVQLRAIAEGLPETVRPRRLSLYRLRLGGQPPNPNGPRFTIIGDSSSRPGQVYELLKENVDYYTDPSLLWIALAQPLNLQSERLVLAYTLRIGGVDTVVADLGGTPDVSYVPDRPQLAHLLWDPQVRTIDPAFRREIRSVYRVAGEDLRRHTVSVRILTGAGAGQEKPLAGTDETYLQMFGLSQSGNPALFDVENRLWPRPGDPNIAIGSTANAKIIRDYFLVLPSTRPFARDGLVVPGNPASDTIYTTPSEDLYSALHPQSQYRIRLRFDIEGGGDVQSVTLGAVQLRPNSETVFIDNVPLIRGDDYTVDYEIGLITFARPDTLFARPRQVTVRYEENPLFAAAPTSIFGISSQIPLDRGELTFMAIRQSQRSSFTRPPLGYEPQSAFIAGVNGRFSFDAPTISRWLERIPTVQSTTLSRFDLQAEFATSRPQPNKAGQAYIESFEGEGGVGVAVAEGAWYYSSQPALGNVLPQRFGAESFGLVRAATMAWQNAGLTLAGFPITYTFSQIDPQVALTGSAFSAPEPLLWLTLYPLNVGGQLSSRTNQFQWLVEGALPGRRWRSVRTSLGPSGSDLSRVEFIEFWTLADTSLAKRATNPTIIIDLGDVSENSVAFGPTSLAVIPVSSSENDSVFTGKALMGFDELNTERDSVSRSFNQATDDRGLPGDVVGTLAVDGPGGFSLEANVPICARGAFQLLLLGDARNNCTVRNGRLDEEDVDLDLVLNFVETQREQERIRRYIVDLANPATYNRIGRCSVAAFDTAGGGSVTATDKCWVQIRVPFRSPDDSLNGGPNIRRVKMVRMTVLSGEGQPDTAFTYVPFGRFKFVGSPWVKRADRTVRGVAGEEPGLGFVVASVIGTQDRDSLRGLDYESPPGVSDEAERQQTGLEAGQTQINERSLRLLAGGLEPLDRAEAYLRFPEGTKNFMNYRELRVWARGRGNGWGEGGELQFFIKVGRDQHNFYMYRTPVSAGSGRTAWLPEVRVDFDKLFTLNEQLQNGFNNALPDSIACTGLDSLIIERSGLPIGQTLRRRAACADGYIVYSVDPAVNPPNLAQVQELAVGMLRVGQGTGGTPIFLSDTLELWVDDIRLTDVERTPGYAGSLSMNLTAGDVANVRVSLNRKDGNFRQLAEQPTFVENTGMSVATNVRLDRLIPGASNYALPLTITHTSGGSEPVFIAQSDLRGAGIAGLRTPRSSIMSYNLSLRRTRLLRTPYVGALVNNLTATANMARSDSRSEFTEGRNAIWNLGLNYNVSAPNARYVGWPAWFTSLWPFRGLDDNRIRWNPAIVSFTSQMGRTNDRRTSYLKPAAVLTDTGRRVNGLTHVWRSNASIEFRPFQAVNARFDLTSTRDLRNYGDTSATAIVASGEREQLLGLDVGLERERQMNTSVSLTPVVSSWFTPSLTLISTYAMQRDPQSRQLVRSEDTVGAFRLPRRLSNTQSLALGASIEPGRALILWRGDTGMVGRIGNAIRPIDLRYSRSLNSAFDGAPFTPGFGYQFAVGGLDDFRSADDRLATLAGGSDQVTLETGFRMPLGLEVRSNMGRVSSSNYTKRLDNSQSIIEGSQQTFPDLRLVWALTPSRGLILRQISMNVGYTHSRQLTFAASETPEVPDDRRVNRSRSYPASISLTWGPNSGLRTVIGGDVRYRVDSVPGSISESENRRLTADVSQSFRLPASWNARAPVRARISWEHDTQSSYVHVEGSSDRSRLADAGRTAINFNADSEVAQNLEFSLQMARVISYDNNFDRRFSQFVLTALFRMHIAAGSIQ